MQVKSAGFGDNHDKGKVTEQIKSEEPNNLSLFEQNQNEDSVNVSMFEEVLTNPDASAKDIEKAVDLMRNIDSADDLQMFYSEEMTEVLKEIKKMDLQMLERRPVEYSQEETFINKDGIEETYIREGRQYNLSEGRSAVQFKNDDGSYTTMYDIDGDGKFDVQLDQSTEKNLGFKEEISSFTNLHTEENMFSIVKNSAGGVSIDTNGDGNSEITYSSRTKDSRAIYIDVNSDGYADLKYVKDPRGKDSESFSVNQNGNWGNEIEYFTEGEKSSANTRKIYNGDGYKIHYNDD